jgi:cation transport ATPase
LLGRPEVATVESMSERSRDEILALATGALGVDAVEISGPVRRAAEARGVPPDAVRSPEIIVGLGVTAFAASGQRLVVGVRALMLNEKMSIAAAEPRALELESQGRQVILVAVGGHLAGLLSLQDRVRRGARASVQRLLDVRVEPVLLAGEARETCEVLARSLDITHVRPEVLASERASEIRRLKAGGSVVAVLGTSPTDDEALKAADVAMLLSGAGTRGVDAHVALLEDGIHEAAIGLGLSQWYRNEARRALLTVAFPSIGGLALVILGAPLAHRTASGSRPSSCARCPYCCCLRARPLP